MNTRARAAADELEVLPASRYYQGGYQMRDNVAVQLLIRGDLAVLQVAALVLAPLLAVAAWSAMCGFLIRTLAALLDLRGVTYPPAFRAALVANFTLVAFGASFSLAYKVTASQFESRMTTWPPIRFESVFWGHLLSFLLVALLYVGALVRLHNLIFSHFLPQSEEGAARKMRLFSVLYLAGNSLLITMCLVLGWIFFRT